MRHRSTARLLSATLLSFTILNGLGVDLQTVTSNPIQLHGDRVEARSTGGRSRSGSFRRSSPSRSNSTPSRSNSSPSRTTTSPSRSTSPRYNPPNTNPVLVPVPVPHSNPTIRTHTTTSSGTSSSASDDDFLEAALFIFGIAGVIVVILIAAYFLQRRRAKSAVGELENDVVTVTKLQVGLLAQARQTQTELSELVANLDTETSEGRMELLRESVLAVLRSPENWTHAYASSQTLPDREQAAQRFEQLSIEERSKLSAETLVNVGGAVRRQGFQPIEENPAAYIVVTLLIGTEDDRPLVESIHTVEELQVTLQQIAALSPERLAVCELIWSPQDAADSLTYDELLTEYSHLIQIA